jgi:hypothetical protein
VAICLVTIGLLMWISSVGFSLAMTIMTSPCMRLILLMQQFRLFPGMSVAGSKDKDCNGSGENEQEAIHDQ